MKGWCNNNTIPDWFLRAKVNSWAPDGCPTQGLVKHSEHGAWVAACDSRNPRIARKIVPQTKPQRILLLYPIATLQCGYNIQPTLFYEMITTLNRPLARLVMSGEISLYNYTTNSCHSSRIDKSTTVRANFSTETEETSAANNTTQCGAGIANLRSPTGSNG